jgi:hypothetical protein
VAVVGNGKTIPHRASPRVMGLRVEVEELDMLARECALMQRAGGSRLGSHGSHGRWEEASSVQSLA